MRSRRSVSEDFAGLGVNLDGLGAVSGRDGHDELLVLALEIASDVDVGSGAIDGGEGDVSGFGIGEEATVVGLLREVDAEGVREGDAVVTLELGADVVVDVLAVLVEVEGVAAVGFGGVVVEAGLVLVPAPVDAGVGRIDGVVEILHVGVGGHGGEATSEHNGADGHDGQGTLHLSSRSCTTGRSGQPQSWSRT